MEDALGREVSLDCGSLGFYQGVIASVRLDEGTLTLTRPFHNGKSSEVDSVTLFASDIQDLTFIEASAKTKQVEKKSKSVIQVPKKKQGVADHIRKNPSTPKHMITQQARFSPALQVCMVQWKVN